nr:MAG TPA: hypothetical protein [Caudoviricetes sp.]
MLFRCVTFRKILFHHIICLSSLIGVKLCHNLFFCL